MYCTPKVLCLTFGVQYILRQPLFLCIRSFSSNRGYAPTCAASFN